METWKTDTTEDVRARLTVEDLQATKPSMTREAVLEFFDRHRDDIESAMVEAAWEVVEDLLWQEDYS